MTLVETLFSQGARAFREPRAAAADLIALGIPREVLLPAMLLVVVLSVIINAVAEALAPSLMSTVTHFQMTVFLLALFVAFALAMCKVGQALGGIGQCQDSLLLAVFFQAIFIPLQIFQVVLLAISPVLASFLALFLYVLGIWVNINFIAALHGYSSLGKAFGVMILSSLVVAVVMMLVAPLVGISLFGAVPNV